MPKRMMILGAGIYQVPLIMKAKEQGFHIIVASSLGNYPGIKQADEFFAIDTTDEDAIVALASELEIDAISTSGTDVAIRSLAKVSGSLGIPGPNTITAEKATDKARMKQAFQEEGVRTSHFQIVRTLSEIEEATELLNFPLMLKCVDKSGSRGITKIERFEDIKPAFDYVKDASQVPYFVLEEFAQGLEIGIDGYVDGKGEIAFLVPHEKLTINNGQSDVPTGHIVSQNIIDHYIMNSDLNDQVNKATTAIGLRGGFFNLDAMVLNNQISIIEVGIRSGATCIPEIISSFYGMNYYEKIIEAASGLEPSFPSVSQQPAVLGQLIYSLEKARLSNCNPKIDNHVEISFDYEIGDIVPAFLTGNHRIGHMIIAGDSECKCRELAKKTLDQVLKTCLV